MVTDIIRVLLTVAAIVIIVLAITKDLEIRTVLLLLSFVIATGVAIFTNAGILADKGTGSVFLDIFEYAKVRWTATYTGTGVTIIPIFGWVAYMEYTKASPMLATLCAKPMSKMKYPYFTVIPFAFLVAMLIRFAIPSQIGLTGLLMATLFPIMVAAGLSKASAATILLLGTTFDWGPADIATTLWLPDVCDLNPTLFFIDYQIKVFIPAILVAIVIACFIQRYYDKKMENKDAGVVASVKDVAELKIPKWYAVFPILPIIFIVLFSKLGLKSVILSTFGCVMLSFAIVVIVDSIRIGLVESFKATVPFYKGTGNGFFTIVTLGGCGTAFGGALTLLGGFEIIGRWFAQANIGGMAIVILLSILAFLVCMFTGSTTTAGYLFLNMIKDVPTYSSLSIGGAFIPYCTILGIGRAFTPVGCVMNIVMPSLDCDRMEIIKRGLIPALSGWVVIVILCAVLY